METVRDYLAFAARFTGLAYVLAYAATSPELGAPLSAMLPAAAVPPGLHLMGALAAGAVAAQNLVLAFRRKRPAPETPLAPPARKANAYVPLRIRAPIVPAMKPRASFGLRGVTND